VTKGAFEAGVLQVLAQRGIAVERIVAASSGALNGVVYAAGVRARRERAAAAEMVELWERHGGWRDVLHLSVRDVLTRRGISDQKNLYALLRDSVLPTAAADPAPIELHLITAPLRGSEGSTLDEPATTYTRVVSFGGQWFDEQEALSRVLTAATASAALPILFTPVDLPGLGPCVDGGLVANTPIRYAYGEDEGASIDAILVVAATPAFLGQPSRDYRGGDLVAHVVDMVFSEWLYQDLRRGRAVNGGLDALAALAEKKGWSPAEQEEIRAAFGWERRHVVPIVSIRPLTPLPGTLFSGFTDGAVRRRYVAVGRERARDVLDRLGWR
jgi:predicted acylesterase/phospholipase RssA